jgi:hypothetical protein
MSTYLPAQLLALWTAFPSPLVGRHAHDYYGNSVTVGLSSRRPSRFPYIENISDWVRHAGRPLAISP